MDTPLKLNTFLKSSRGSDISPNIVLFYKCLQLISGLNFGFFKFNTRRANFSFKYLTLMISLTICITNVCYALCYTPFILYWYYVFQTAHYVVNILILSGMKTNLYEYLNEMRRIDDNINLHKTTRHFDEEKIAILISLFIFALKTFMTAVVWIYFKEFNGPLIAIILLHIVWSSPGFVAVNIALVYVSSFRRLIKLTHELEVTNIRYDACKNAYRSIVDTTETMKASLDPLVSALAHRHVKK